MSRAPGAGGPRREGHKPLVVVLGSSDNPTPSGLDEIRDQVEFRLVEAQDLARALPGADALLLWDFFSEALAGAWSTADRLRWIHVAAAGVDKLLFDELVSSDVVVTNARGVFDRPIAEFVLASILAFTKDLYTSRNLQQVQTWRHRETLRLEGRHALVVGTGGIGRATARLLQAAGMVVRGVGRRPRNDDPDFGEVVESGDLAAHAGWADHLVIAAPLTAQTHGLVDAQVLAALPRGAQLVNVGRGPLVDEDALIAALRAGRLASAALDVFSIEPLPTDHPLWTVPGVVITPHMSGDVLGWRDVLAEQFLANLRRWLAGEPLVNVVDKTLGYVSSASPTTAPLDGSR